jgi:hypothetical protein
VKTIEVVDVKSPGKQYPVAVIKVKSVHSGSMLHPMEQMPSALPVTMGIDTTRTGI